MKNRVELVKALEGMRKEFVEALQKGNTKMQDLMAKEILRLEMILQEEEVKKSIFEVKEKLNQDIVFEIETEVVFRQGALEKSFKKKLKELYLEKKDTSNNSLSERQAQTIMSGMRDRVGLDINAEQIAFINKLNINQASEIIRLLNGISFYNQRLQVTKALETLKDREDYGMILLEVKNNIHRKEWFDMNSELITMSRELQEPTEAQIRKIADVARYIETHKTLIMDFDIDVNEFEQRPDGKLYYTFNWNALKSEIKEKFNRESASNFIQTYDYITNFYEGNKLDKDQITHLRNLYMQLGEYECTKMTYLMTITKQYYDTITKELESKVRYNKIANNESNKKYREAIYTDNNLVKRNAKSREVRSISVKKEQQEARELCNFVFGIYSCIGQSVPEEMDRILPYFVEGGECKYAGVEEQHYGEFRRLVFEQRELIKEIDPHFQWGAFVCNQPTHILKALGLDMIV